jgi:GTP pyrophosphokinase
MIATPPLTSIPTSSLIALLDALPDQSPASRALVERAYHRAETAHAGQMRKSGEPYFTHCLAVAQILVEMRLDAEAIAAALLHDVAEDTPITIDDLRAEFGEAVARIVDGVTKLKNLPSAPNDKRSRNADRGMEYIRKMALTMNDDVRVVLVKLADRLHNMRTLDYMTAEKQRQIAQETLDIFAPLANRLGVWQFKSQLEDLCLRYLDAEAYADIARRDEESRVAREAYIGQVVATLREELAKHGITNVTITGRPKHIYSIYKKMERKHVGYDKIFDVRAVRVIVETIPQCYLVLGIVHNMWRPIPNEFDDYIAAPKDNFYRSLHTAVVDSKGKTVEVQIRTWDMHEHAEYGIAAHWRYKEGGKGARDSAFEERLKYLRHLLEFGEEANDPAEFVNSMKTDLLPERVYIYTPKGQIIDLPAGATPIDFAYAVHTDVGHRCSRARVNGKEVPLNSHLRTGDQVEIITNNRGGPSLDWLNENLGYVTTSRARSKINHWFRRQNRDKNIAAGRDGLEKELKRLGLLDAMPFETVAHLFNYEKLDDFLAAIGTGDVNGGQISKAILDKERERKEVQTPEQQILRAVSKNKSSVSVDISNGVTVLGADGTLVNLARCCNPMIGEPIIGYITRGRGVTVHRSDCPNVLSMPDHEKERLIDAAWGKASQEQRYAVPIEIVAYDREGLLRDISTVIADERVSMSAVKVDTRQDIATFQLTMELANMNQLTRILSRLENVDSVFEAHRRNDR